jgi:hypothetical protein
MAFLESQQGLLALLATLCGITGAIYVRGGKSERALGWFGVAALLVWPLVGFDAQSRAPAPGRDLMDLLRDGCLENAQSQQPSRQIAEARARCYWKYPSERRRP